jgi:hypothetical protein
MTERKNSCGECHWWRNRQVFPSSGKVIGNCCIPVPDSCPSGAEAMFDLDGALCDTFRQRGERLPQRFKVWLSGGWTGGICWPMTNGRWSISLLTMHDSFDSDPTESLKMFVGDAEVAWIDNDFGWKGNA